MNWDTVQGRWKEMKGKARQKWSKITDDEFERIAGKREELEGTLQRVYGKTKDQVKKEVDEFANQCGCE